MMGRGWRSFVILRRQLPVNAAQRSNMQVCKWFSAESAQPATLLHDAIKTGDDRAAVRSLQDGADINARDSKGWTPLHLSLLYKRPGIAQQLIDSGADLNVKSKQGFSPRELALFANMTDTANQLPKSEAASNFFSDSNLQRMSGHRKNTSFIQEISSSDNAQYIILRRNDVLVKHISRHSAEIILAGYELIKPFSHNRTVFLGKSEGKYLFAIHIDKESAQEIQESLPGSSLLPAFPGALNLTQEDAALYGHAVGVLSWQQNHTYCSLCGYKTSITHGGYKTVCSNEHCSSHKGALGASYPRLDPTIICSVVSEDQSHMILARQPRFPSGMYSCIAGFIEPGESVEVCCQREVREEVGLAITDVRYVSSQFWPLPPSLMLGCQATADMNSALKVDTEELEESRWFTRDEVVLMMLGRHSEGLFAPPRQAIAHQLIKHWLINSANS